MKVTRIVLAGILFVGAGFAFGKDFIRIGNETGRELHFAMRCLDSDHPWKSFAIQPHKIATLTSSSCQEFGFEKSTRDKGDDSVQKVKYRLPANTYHVMFYNEDKRAFDLKKMSEREFMRHVRR